MVYGIKHGIPKDKLATFCRRHHIKKLALFGSVLRNEMRPESDVDLLVEFEEGRTPGLFDISRMEIELTDTLGHKVDLRTAEELSRYFRDEVMRVAEVQYEARA